MRPTFTLPDPRTGTQYQVFVATAAGRLRAPSSRVGRPGSDPLPAVLFLDGDNQFEAALKAYRSARRERTVPPLVLVGVGYGAGYTQPGNRRVRDYTPTLLATEAGSGGADGFYAFLTGTLWPELSRRYAIREDLRGLAGHSLGSLFVVHAMLQRPLFFNRLLASAPSLWWDDRAVLCAAERFQRTGAPVAGRLFLSVGENDTVSMTTDLEQFEQQLAAAPIPELAVISKKFPGRDHYDVLELAFRAGLDALFGDAR